MIKGVGKMKLFENKVGRPSNEILKKRNIFNLFSLLAIIGIVGISAVVLTKYNNVEKLKGSSGSKSCTISFSSVAYKSYNIKWNNCQNVEKLNIYESNEYGEKEKIIKSKNVLLKKSYLYTNMLPNYYYYIELLSKNKKILKSVLTKVNRNYDFYSKSNILYVLFDSPEKVRFNISNYTNNKNKVKLKQCSITKSNKVIKKFKSLNYESKLNRNTDYKIDCVFADGSNISGYFKTPNSVISIVNPKKVTTTVKPNVQDNNENNEEYDDINWEEFDNPITLIDVNQFESLISKNNSFILLFSNNSCSHCKNYKVTIENIGLNYNLTIYEINMDELTSNEIDIIGKYIDIRGVPTTIFVKNGKIATEKIEGNISYNEVVNIFKEQGFIK